MLIRNVKVMQVDIRNHDDAKKYVHFVNRIFYSNEFCKFTTEYKYKSVLNTSYSIFT